MIYQHRLRSASQGARVRALCALNDDAINPRAPRPVSALPDQDAWGTPLHVTYKDERVYEQVIVRSAGKDKIFANDDDIVEKRKQINMKGLGGGIKKIDTAGVAASVAKGVVIGIKEAIKEGHDKPRP